MLNILKTVFGFLVLFGSESYKSSPTVFLVGASNSDKAKQIADILEANPSLKSAGSFDNKLYFVSKANGNWAEAKQICLDSKLALVDVDTEAELKYLVPTLRSVARGSYWTSAQDSEVFKWSTGSSVPIVLQNDASKNCLLLNTDWNDRLWIHSCGAEESFPLCQFQFVDLDAKTSPSSSLQPFKALKWIITVFVFLKVVSFQV